MRVGAYALCGGQREAVPESDYEPHFKQLAGGADLLEARAHELVIYPDAGHGGIFQCHEQFVETALEFLAR